MDTPPPGGPRRPPPHARGRAAPAPARHPRLRGPRPPPASPSACGAPLGASCPRRPAPRAPEGCARPDAIRGGRAARLPGKRGTGRSPGRAWARAPPGVRPAGCQALHTFAAAARRPQALHVLQRPGAPTARPHPPPPPEAPAQGSRLGRGHAPAPQAGPPGQVASAAAPLLGSRPGSFKALPLKEPLPLPLTMMAYSQCSPEARGRSRGWSRHRARSAVGSARARCPPDPGTWERRHTGQRVRGGWRGRGAPAD